MVASAAAVISVVAFAGRGGGAGAAFNACISQARFLVLVRHASGNKAIETIKDRAHGAVVGEFALLFPSERQKRFPPPSQGPERKMAGMSCSPQFLLAAMPPRSSSALIASSRRSPLDQIAADLIGSWSARFVTGWRFILSKSRAPGSRPERGMAQEAVHEVLGPTDGGPAIVPHG